MSRFTRKATIRYIAYKDEFLIKEPNKSVRVPSRFLKETISRKGWSSYFPNHNDLTYFFEKYYITAEIYNALKRRHRSARTRIIVLVKREK